MAPDELVQMTDERLKRLYRRLMRDIADGNTSDATVERAVACEAELRRRNHDPESVAERELV